LNQTLLNSAKLPSKLWNSTILCAAYLYNLNSHQSINNKIPNELFFHRVLDISHLKIFGCKAFFYNNHKFNKFNNNTKPGIFLGYASDSLGYKIFNTFTNSIVTSRHTWFMEDIPGTINTTFFCDNYIDSFINFQDFLIEVESNSDIVILIIITFIRN